MQLDSLIDVYIFKKILIFLFLHLARCSYDMKINHVKKLYLRGSYFLNNRDKNKSHS